MSRLLYESSVSYKGFLIIPFVFGIVDCQNIYSYKLLSDQGYKGKLHKSENPSGICSDTVEEIIDIAKEYLDSNIDVLNSEDNLVVMHSNGKLEIRTINYCRQFNELSQVPIHPNHQVRTYPLR